MTAPVFVDTNVFVYYLDPFDPVKHAAAKFWLAELWKRRLGRISYQVLQEFYSATTQKWPTLQDRVRAQVADLLAWHPLIIDSSILANSWIVQDRYKISFWDALIVAAAKHASCGYLLTEDLQADQEVDGVVVVNPFRSRPGEILSTGC